MTGRVAVTISYPKRPMTRRQSRLPPDARSAAASRPGHTRCWPPGRLRGWSPGWPVTTTAANREPARSPAAASVSVRQLHAICRRDFGRTPMQLLGRHPAAPRPHSPDRSWNPAGQRSRDGEPAEGQELAGRGMPDQQVVIRIAAWLREQMTSGGRAGAGPGRYR